MQEITGVEFNVNKNEKDFKVLLTDSYHLVYFYTFVLLITVEKYRKEHNFVSTTNLLSKSLK